MKDKLQFYMDLFWFKVMTFSSNRMSDHGKMALVIAMERRRAKDDHERVLH